MQKKYPRIAKELSQILQAYARDIYGPLHGVGGNLMGQWRKGAVVAQLLAPWVAGGMSERTAWAIWSGKNNIGLDKLPIIAAAWNISITIKPDGIITINDGVASVPMNSEP